MVAASEIIIHIPEIVKHITGERLTGLVKFRLDKDEVYENVSVTLVEKTCSRYIYDHRDIPDYRTISVEPGDLSQYQTRKVVKVNLLPENKKENTVLKAGTYEYPFEMTIPEDTPPSARTTIKNITVAGIRYFLILKFRKPDLFVLSEYFVTKLTIFPRIDSASMEKPVIASIGKTLTKLFTSKKHEIEVKIEVDKEHLTPSCERKISFNVTNDTDAIFTIETELICITKTSLPFSKTKERTEVLATVETPCVPDNSVSNIYNIIPVALNQVCVDNSVANMSNAIPVGVYTVRHSKVISREFKYRVTLKLPAPHSNVFVEIPMFAGERV